MKPTTKSLGLRLTGALRDASWARDVAPLPGLEEVKEAAKNLVHGIQSIETHHAKRAAISRRIATILGLLQSHLNGSEPSLELQYFFNKMVMCHEKLSELDIKRGATKTLRAAQQLEMLEILEREISSDFQDAIFALLIQRLPSPSSSQPPSPSSLPPAITIKESIPEKSVAFPVLEPFYDYPRVNRYELSLNTIVRRTRGRSEPNSPLVKSVASGKYMGRNVLVVQYSSRIKHQDVFKEFVDDVGAVIQERHPNVLEFIGASDDSAPGQPYFMVLGGALSRDVFLRSACSAQQIFTFYSHQQSGMHCLLDHGVQTWKDIYVSEDGRAVIHPPYWDYDYVWDKSNYDVFSSLSGVTQSSDFPLGTLAEILNISGPRWKSFQSAVLSHTGTAIRDYHLMHIASELDLPIPPFLLTYYGPVPNFILSVGSVGLPDYDAGDSFHGTMCGWTAASSLWSCAGWEALHTHALEYWIPPSSNERDEDETAITGVSGAISVDTLESSSDGWLSYGYFDSDVSFGVGYEMAISDLELFEMSWDRFCSTKLDGLVHLSEERQDFHAVRHVSVTVHCQPESLRGLFPLYFHRRPSSLFNAEHYWGFFSEDPDPSVVPCHIVKKMPVYYSV
ncbi:RNA pseudouridylate synthase domain protein [Ceratobasidium sp. AG-Ba]|nr:RNA pseudouridylate synthase domain protein [Ceratobasidium sp. AG-Ba]